MKVENIKKVKQLLSLRDEYAESLEILNNYKDVLRCAIIDFEKEGNDGYLHNFIGYDRQRDCYIFRDCPFEYDVISKLKMKNIRLGIIFKIQYAILTNGLDCAIKCAESRLSNINNELIEL